MAEFLVGVQEKYPAPILKGRLSVEGNVISCLMKDMLLIDDTHLDTKDFITADGFFYYGMLKQLREKGFYSLDEVTIRSNLPESVIEQFEDRGGWNSIQHQMDIINTDNFDTYLDILHRENIFCKMCDDGFNLIKSIDINGKSVAPLKLLRKFTAEEVVDWYDARLTSYGGGYSNKITGEETITFDDEFINDCAEGVESGLQFSDAGMDINLETINCFPFLSKRISGFLPGTLNVMAGYSGCGKSTIMITILMALLENEDEKVLIITNEEDIKTYKIKFLVWLLSKYEKYYKLTKKKLIAGDLSDEDKEHLNNVKEYWNEKYANRVKIISIADADMNIVKKKMRENILREGASIIFYDTMKLDFNNSGDQRTDLAIVKDTRDLDAIAKKYNVVMLASLQLAIHTQGRLWLGAECLSNCKSAKEVMSNLLLMRPLYNNLELDKENKKYYCNPFRYKKVDGKWVEEPYECDPTASWRVIFIDKARRGSTSIDDGSCILSRFDGDHAIFRETCFARIKQGYVQ